MDLIDDDHLFVERGIDAMVLAIVLQARLQLFHDRLIVRGNRLGLSGFPFVIFLGLFLTFDQLGNRTGLHLGERLVVDEIVFLSDQPLDLLPNTGALHRCQVFGSGPRGIRRPEPLLVLDLGNRCLQEGF